MARRSRSPPTTSPSTALWKASGRQPDPPALAGAVLAELLAQDVADLAQRRQALQCLPHRHQQVLGAPGRSTDIFQCRLHGGVVAPGAQVRQALGLVAL